VTPSEMPTRLAAITPEKAGKSLGYPRTVDAAWPRMRWLTWVLVVAACGGNEEGALLVLDAPEGVTAQRIEIVLVSTERDAIVDIDGQRVQPTELAMEPVRYYRQRALTAAITEVGTLQGFALRLEPNDELPEGELIPFLIAYDDRDRVGAIGAVLDANGQPTAIEIIPDQLLRFEVAMQALAETDGAQGIATGQAMSIDCETFTRSGIAWQPGATQLRLLLPDRSQDPGATDASERLLDMDCDGKKAFEDCDDLRSAFHPGAPESCDGMDMDCDFRLHELVTCDHEGSSCGDPTGIAICAEGNGTTTACEESPECACEDGSCATCIVPFEGLDGGPAEPCAPAIESALAITDCGGDCEVEVLPRPGDPWRVQIALPPTGTFGPKLSNVVDKVMLQVDGVDALAAGSGDIVGGVFLRVTNAVGTHQVSFALKLASQSTTCPAAEIAPMICL
jgi:hypothetical protein